MYRETIGLDMEACGVVYATQNATTPRPKALVFYDFLCLADSRGRFL